ncbi:MAG: hypothetical protein EXS31_04580 [Pedosphaera sp.]|nr:hypothetical protein [Pedosphaera sp.]
MNKLTHILVTLAFSFACFSLWAMLTAVANLSPHWAQTPPAFTRFCLSLRPCILALPLPVAACCVFALVRKQSTPEAVTAFIACTMTALCLVFFPALMAVLLPCLQLLEAR